MRKSVIAVVMITLCLPCCAYALDWKRLHEQADKKDAQKILASAKEHPDSLNDLYMLGLVYLNQHKDTEAYEAFTSMLALDSAVVEAQWGRAEVLRRKKELQESEHLLVAIIKSNPEFAPAYISLGYLRYTQADFKGALRLAVQVKKKGKHKIDVSNYTRAYLIIGGAKGMIASRGGPISKIVHGTQVLPYLKKAEKLQPDAPAVLFGLGSFYFLAPSLAGGNVDKAVDYLQRAIAADPLFADAYVRLAQVYKSKGDLKQYQIYMDQAFQLDPDNALAKDEMVGVCKFSCVTVEEGSGTLGREVGRW